ncbi:cell division protein ZapE [Ruicaihuangia caeni]|uniref:Cell division protein ZapE n=1 Tax=Ruicaihuangia caeni TaxID=3042517 RepID=A0AAW6T7L7_9MICO|nr:cell division protein ZapE [Klugiella sp. YN-L-19]MDI2097632.1 cell division protein ZapE [Klugiella sp. YN-L-19]
MGPRRVRRAVERAAAAEGFELDQGQRSALARLTASGAPNVYVHGPVGRGKSWLVDTWFATMPVPKRRVHFHGFLTELQRAIVANAYDTDAAIDALLGGIRLLVFDEFHVHDPADALLLTRSLSLIEQRQVRVVVTSNYAPNELLPDPVFEHVALPLRAAVTRAFEVVEVAGARDYRRTSAADGNPTSDLPGAPSVNGTASRGLRGVWHISDSVNVAEAPAVVLELGGRRFEALDADGSSIRFHWTQLCEAPVAASDIVAWADRFDHWTLLGVPPLARTTLAARQRFANLVDVLSDRGHELVVHAAVERQHFVDEPAANPHDVERMLSRLALLDAAG